MMCGEDTYRWRQEAIAQSAIGEWQRVPKDDRLYSRVLEHVQTISEKTREVFLFTDNGEMWKLELPPLNAAPDRGATKA
jgi:hypothetical protein